MRITVKQTSKKAFTLIEVLIAVTIVVVILLSIYSALNTGILSYKKIDSALDTYQETRIVLSKMETELKNSFAYWRKSNSFKGDSQSLDFFTVLDTYSKDGLATKVCRIKYQPASMGVNRTICSGGGILDEKTGCETENLSDVLKNISFEYAAGMNNDGTIIWQANWPGNEKQLDKMPLAVRVKIILTDKLSKKENTGSFTKIMPIMKENIEEQNEEEASKE